MDNKLEEEGVRYVCYVLELANCEESYDDG